MIRDEVLTAEEVEGQMRYFTKEEQKKYTEAVNKMFKPVESEKEKLLAKHILELQADKGRLTDRVRELEAQIEKMKCCANCKYFYCPTSSRNEKDGKVLFHNWNKEKQAYCDCGNGEGKKYQLWEIKEK